MSFGLIVPNARCISTLTNSLDFAVLFFSWLVLAWFLFFPQDTQKRYPYQGRLCLPLFCPFNVFLMSALCFFLVVCRFGLLLFVLFCSVLIYCSFLSSFSVCLCSSKREKISIGGTIRSPSCHTRPRLLPNIPEWLYAVIYVCGSMSVSKICFFFFFHAMCV